MGYGLPAALGAKAYAGDRPVINFSGDGSILMNIQELMTASESGLNVVNIILNNNFFRHGVGSGRAYFTGSVSHRPILARSLIL